MTLINKKKKNLILNEEVNILEKIKVIIIIYLILKNLL